MLIINGKEHNSLSVAADADLFKGIRNMASILGKTKAFDKSDGSGLGEVGAAAFLLAAVDYGVPPMLAAQGRLHWVEQKASPSAATMLGMAYEVGVRVKFKTQSDTGVSGTFTRDGTPDLDVEYTIEDARRAGLSGKDNWKKYPQDMLTARFLSRGLRLIAADVLAGVYSVEELGDGDIPNNENTHPSAKVALADATTDFQQASAPAPAAPRPHTPPPASAPSDDRPESPEHKEPLVEPPTAPAKAPVLNRTGASRPATTAKAPANAKLDITEHVAVAIQENTPISDGEGRTGGTLDINKTAKEIYTSLRTVFPEGMTRGMLAEKLKGYGAKSSADLTSVQAMSMVQWANEQVKKQKDLDAAADAAGPMLPTEADETNTDIPAFNPQRGAATTSRTSALKDATPENYDDQIEGLHQQLFDAGKVDDANEVYDEYGYDSDTSSQQTKRLVRDGLRAKLTDAA